MGWFSDEYLQQLRDEQERYRQQSPGDWRLAADPMSVQRIENTLRMRQWQREGNVQALAQFEAAQQALQGGKEVPPEWANAFITDEYLQMLLDEMESYKQMYGADWSSFVDPMVVQRINTGISMWQRQRQDNEGNYRREEPMLKHLEHAFRQPEPLQLEDDFEDRRTSKFGQLPRLSEQEKARLLSHRTETSMFDVATILTNAGINEDHALSIHGWATMGRDILMAMINAKGSLKEAICALHPQLSWVEDGDLDKACQGLAAHYGVPATNDLFGQVVSKFTSNGEAEVESEIAEIRDENGNLVGFLNTGTGEVIVPEWLGKVTQLPGAGGMVQEGGSPNCGPTYDPECFADPAPEEYFIELDGQRVLREDIQNDVIPGDPSTRPHNTLALATMMVLAQYGGLNSGISLTAVEELAYKVDLHEHSMIDDPVARQYLYDLILYLLLGQYLRQKNRRLNGL